MNINLVLNKRTMTTSRLRGRNFAVVSSDFYTRPSRSLSTTVRIRPPSPTTVTKIWPATSFSTSASTSSSDSPSVTMFLHGHECDPALVNSQRAPKNFDDPRSVVVYRNVVSECQERTLIKEISSRMKRRRYERGHWDAVITGYKEVELSDISFLPLATSDERRDDKHDYDDDYCDENNPQTIIPAIFEQIRQHLAERHLNHNHNKSSIRWLPCHAIDLKKDGELKAHVDSVRFSGDLVAGLSLKSPSIMRLKIPPKGYNNDTDDEERESGQRDDSSNVGGCNDDDGYIDLFLPPRSLYALTGIGRYCYSHELLPDQSTFVEPATGIETLVRRDHRISIIFRDAKHE